MEVVVEFAGTADSQMAFLLVLVRIYMDINILPQNLPSFVTDMPSTVQYKAIKNFPHTNHRL